jgi:hypothetical protein
MHTCSIVFRHYISPRNADSQANDDRRTTEATSPYWRIACRLLPVKRSTWDEIPRRAAANRKASESWGEAWQRGDPACERRHVQPDPLRSQSRTAPSTPVLSSHTCAGACQPLSRRRSVSEVYDMTNLRYPSLFLCTSTSWPCSLSLIGLSRCDRNSRGVNRRLGSIILRPECPDWAVTPLHWHCMRRRPLRPEDAPALAFAASHTLPPTKLVSPHPW